MPKKHLVLEFSEEEQMDIINYLNNSEERKGCFHLNYPDSFQDIVWMSVSFSSKWTACISLVPQIMFTSTWAGPAYETTITIEITAPGDVLSLMFVLQERIGFKPSPFFSFVCQEAFPLEMNWAGWPFDPIVQFYLVHQALAPDLLQGYRK